jgi:hypothetical protein
MVLAAIMIIIFVQSSRGADINIVDIYSDINSADMTLQSDKYYTGITINADLVFEGKVLASRHLTIDEISPNMPTTKVLSWNITDAPDGLYRTTLTLFVNGNAIETKYYNFSHGWGWQASPNLYIKDIMPDSSGVSVILAPFIPQSGSDEKPVLTDVEYILVDGSTVIYRTTDRRISVEQATTLSKNWNIRLLNNHAYSARVKVRISAQEDNVIAGSRDFTAMEDAHITELYRDETGASITILGSSQVPFIGNIEFTVSENGQVIEDIREPSPILMSGDDKTIEIVWKNRLPPGIYELSVSVMDNDGFVIDRKDTIIEAKKSTDQGNFTTPVPTQSPDFTIVSTVALLMVLYLFSRWKGSRKR